MYVDEPVHSRPAGLDEFRAPPTRWNSRFRPKGAVAVFWSTDSSTLEPDVRRIRREKSEFVDSGHSRVSTGDWGKIAA